MLALSDETPMNKNTPKRTGIGMRAKMGVIKVDNPMQIPMRMLVTLCSLMVVMHSGTRNLKIQRVKPDFLGFRTPMLINDHSLMSDTRPYPKPDFQNPSS